MGRASSLLWVGVADMDALHRPYHTTDGLKLTGCPADRARDQKCRERPGASPDPNNTPEGVAEAMTRTLSELAEFVRDAEACEHTILFSVSAFELRGDARPARRPLRRLRRILHARRGHAHTPACRRAVSGWLLGAVLYATFVGRFLAGTWWAGWARRP
jgi:hypothetical protein